MSGAPAGDSPLHPARIASALHPLESPPRGRGWNHDDLADLLVETTAWREAAVLVGLVPRTSGMQVLLTRRTDVLRHHAGQVSFPGGRIEPGDRDAVDAALRETREELGIAPELVRPLGYLDPLVTITGFRVLPVVAMIEPTYVAQPDPNEVAEAFEVPLVFLLDRSNLVSLPIELQGRTRHVWEYRYPAQRIWGATASMLLNLRDRLECLR